MSLKPGRPGGLRYVLLLLVPVLCQATILPETIGEFHRTNAAPASVSDKAIWDEYGLKEAETAGYQGDHAKFSVTAWQLADTTGAMAAFDWQRPAQATASKLSPLSAQTSDGALIVEGNYLLSFQGRKPEPNELAALLQSLQRVERTPLPPLPSYLPAQGLIANTERYITGPQSLASFCPGIPASAAGFQFGSEAVAGQFRTGKGSMELAVFSYPTPAIARRQEAELGRIPGAIAKRSGSLVAVVLNPPDAGTAGKLLEKVHYQASVTLDEYVPGRKDNIGNLVVNAFILIGILLALATVSGLVVGTLRALRRRGSKGEEAEALVTLHLNRH